METKKAQLTQCQMIQGCAISKAFERFCSSLFINKYTGHVFSATVKLSKIYQAKNYLVMETLAWMSLTIKL
ncbi:MAG: hypothetical protein ACN4GM_11375 [Gammaproteobacteria bacterium]